MKEVPSVSPTSWITSGVAMKRTAVILALIVLLANALAGRADAGVIEVKLGATVERTWEQLRADKYAYGPKRSRKLAEVIGWACEQARGDACSGNAAEVGRGGSLHDIHPLNTAALLCCIIHAQQQSGRGFAPSPLAGEGW